MDFSSTTATCTHGAMLASLSEVEESFNIIVPLSAIANAARVIPKSKESGAFRSKSRDISKCFPSPKSVPSAASTTPFLQPLDFRKSASFSGEPMTSARLREKFLSKISRAVPSPSAAKDTVSESSKAGSAFPARDFPPPLSSPKSLSYPFFLNHFLNSPPLNLGSVRVFSHLPSGPILRESTGRRFASLLRGTAARQTFGEDATALHGLKPMSFANFQRLGFDEVAHFQNQLGGGGFLRGIPRRTRRRASTPLEGRRTPRFCRPPAAETALSRAARGRPPCIRARPRA